LIVDPSLEYPDSGDYYSPDECFPEYQHTHISARPNPIYRGVRACLAQAGLDKTRVGSADWNPLGDYIKPGNHVFVLCNFVYHRRPSESRERFLAKCTHGSVLRTLVDYVLLAIGNTGSVLFGNAPVQSCIWDRVLADTGARVVEEFYRQRGLRVRARDLRAFVAEYDVFGRELGHRVDETQPLVTVDLGADSLLAMLDCPKGSAPRFRVDDYNPRRTDAYHSASSHRYVISRTILDADVVINLSKLKTHEKVGITCGLKGFVGAVGQKECLAHHRLGNPRRGGDEYPETSTTRYLLSSLQDWVQQLESTQSFRGAFQILNAFIRRLLRIAGVIQLGSWHGNDTAWRMALDIARIVHYCESSGMMHSMQQRAILSFVDGVIGGEGDGPLSPKPVNSGILVFSDDVAVGDEAASCLMGFDPSKVAIIREAFSLQKYPLVHRFSDDAAVVCNGQPLSLTDLTEPTQYRYEAPRGWLGWM